jgi:hypothetical protein
MSRETSGCGARSRTRAASAMSQADPDSRRVSPGQGFRDLFAEGASAAFAPPRFTQVLEPDGHQSAWQPPTSSCRRNGGLSGPEQQLRVSLSGRNGWGSLPHRQVEPRAIAIGEAIRRIRRRQRLHSGGIATPRGRTSRQLGRLVHAGGDPRVRKRGCARVRSAVYGIAPPWEQGPGSERRGKSASSTRACRR